METDYLGTNDWILCSTIFQESIRFREIKSACDIPDWKRGKLGISRVAYRRFSERHVTK